MVKISWRDIIPVNLRMFNFSFIKSSVVGEFDENFLELFVKTIGYLMYDRQQKLELLYDLARQTESNSILNITKMLDVCKTTENFTELLKEQFLYIQTLLSNINDFADLTPENSEKNIIEMTRDYMEKIIQYSQNSEFYDRFVQNDAMRNMIFKSRTEMREGQYSVWQCALEQLANKTVPESEKVDILLSLILQDFIISTACDTPATFNYIIRMILLFSFYINMFFNKTSLSIKLVDANDELLKCITHGDTINGNHVIATTIIYTIRMFFFQCITWPISLRENYSDEMVGNFKTYLANSLSNHKIEQPWIRVMKRRNTENRKKFFVQIYMQYVKLFALFEQLGKCCVKNNTIDPFEPIQMRINDASLSESVKNFQSLFDIVKNSIDVVFFNSKIPDDDLLESSVFSFLTATNLAECEKNIFESSTNLINLKNTHALFLNLQAEMLHKLFKLRMSEKLVRTFIEGLFGLWNDKIGLCTLEQLTATTFEIYKLFIQHESDWYGRSSSSSFAVSTTSDTVE